MVCRSNTAFIIISKALIILRAAETSEARGARFQPKRAAARQRWALETIEEKEGLFSHLRGSQQQWLSTATLLVSYLLLSISHFLLPKLALASNVIHYV